MTRPPTRLWSPLVTMVVLAMGVVASAGLGLRMHTAIPDRVQVSVPVAATSHSVQMANFAFAPQVITVTVGDSITWTNQDQAPHTVTTTSAPRSISSPMLSKGQSFSYTFTVAGTYSYYCAVHPDMRAQVVVNPAPAPPTKPSTAAPAQPAHSSTSAAARPAAPSTGHTEHTMAPTSGAPASSPTASTASSAAAAPPVTSPSATTSAPDTDAAAGPSPTESSHTLSPTLVLAGLAAGATVFCLLLVASRRNDEESP